jgi:hypothetical protein
MIDWMVEVTHAFKLDDRTFFLSVAVMDKYIQLEKTRLNPSELHSIGVTAMFMASKFEDLCPLSLNSVYAKIGHEAVSKEKILSLERRIFQTLKFNLSMVTCYDVLMILIENMKVRGFERRMKNSVMEKATFLCKMALHKQRYIILPPSLVASSAIYAALVHEKKKMVQRFNDWSVSSKSTQSSPYPSLKDQEETIIIFVSIHILTY